MLKKFKDYHEIEKYYNSFPSDFRKPIDFFIEKAIPPEFRHIKFDMFDESLKSTLEKVSINLLNDNPVGLLLMGNIGTGKTSALWWLSKIYAVRTYIEYLYRFDKNLNFDNLREPLLYPEIINCYSYLEITCGVRTAFQHTTNMRFNFQNNTEYKEMGRLYNLPNMFIDDFGVELDDAGGWNKTLWDEFIDYRWRWSKPLFITTNFMLDEMKAWNPWARVVDRLTTKKKMIRIQIKGGSKR